MFGILGFFYFSSVDELESFFVVFEKIWGIRSSGPKILPSFVNVPLFIEKKNGHVFNSQLYKIIK